MRSQSSGDQLQGFAYPLSLVVSIADAKPILWRPVCLYSYPVQHECFNRRCEANPLATNIPVSIRNGNLCFNRRCEANPLATAGLRYQSLVYSEFQSQMRSQSSGDMSEQMNASVSKLGFNRRCEANPLATFLFPRPLAPVRGFNRRCEANPLATQKLMLTLGTYTAFQSQMRSQSSGDPSKKKGKAS